MATFKRFAAHIVTALDATYIVRIDNVVDADMRRITLVPNQFKPHTCSDKELCVLEGTFPTALAESIVNRICEDNVQLWFARDIMSYAAKYQKIL